MPPGPEEKARERIDALLAQAGWEVFDPRETNIRAVRGAASAHSR